MLIYNGDLLRHVHRHVNSCAAGATQCLHPCLPRPHPASAPCTLARRLMPPCVLSLLLQAVLSDPFHQCSAVSTSSLPSQLSPQLRRPMSSPPTSPSDMLHSSGRGGAGNIRPTSHIDFGTDDAQSLRPRSVATGPTLGQKVRTSSAGATATNVPTGQLHRQRRCRKYPLSRRGPVHHVRRVPGPRRRLRAASLRGRPRREPRQAGAFLLRPTLTDAASHPRRRPRSPRLRSPPPAAAAPATSRAPAARRARSIRAPPGGRARSRPRPTSSPPSRTSTCASCGGARPPCVTPAARSSGGGSGGCSPARRPRRGAWPACTATHMSPSSTCAGAYSRTTGRCTSPAAAPVAKTAPRCAPCRP